MGYLEALRKAVRDSSGMHPALCTDDWVDGIINGLTNSEVLHLMDVVNEEERKKFQ